MFFKIISDVIFISNIVGKDIGYKVLEKLDMYSPSELGMLIYGGYKIEEFLGRGASSLVLKVSNENGEKFALKTILNNYEENEIENEILRTSNNIMGIIHFYGEVSTVDGLKNGLLIFPVGKTLSVIDRHNFNKVPNLIKGLSWLHENNYIHRDIRPQNIIETDDGMYLIDFSFAINLNAGENYTIRGTRRFGSRNVLEILKLSANDKYPVEVTYSVKDDLESFLKTMYVLLKNESSRLMKTKKDEDIENFWKSRIFELDISKWKSLFDDLPSEYEKEWYDSLYNRIHDVSGI